jgi:hypothetical protein
MEMPLPDPPAKGDGETDVAVMARWLNSVVLCLEEALVLLEYDLG